MSATTTPAWSAGKSRGRQARMIELRTRASAIRRFSRSLLGDLVLERLERVPADVDRLVVRVRPRVQVLAADRAEPRAVRAAERRDRGGEDELLAEKRVEIELEVGADRLRVERRLDERRTPLDGNGRVVLLGELRVHRR